MLLRITMSEDLIAPDIRVAKTLPSIFYTSKSIFEKLKTVFSGWQFALHKSELDDNNIVPLHHVEDATGEQIIMVRSDEVKCLSNICTHRGMKLVEQDCSKRSIQCKYHGRTFDLNGQMKNMPEFEDVVDFPSALDDLHEFEMGTWQGLNFVSQQTNKSPIWEEFVERFEFLGVENYVHDLSKKRDHLIEANWMLYVDNYLEGFHIPFVHPELNDALDYSGYTTEVFENGVLQVGEAKEGEISFDLPETHPDFGKQIAAYYLWLFPNMMFNFYPWGLSVNIVIPISPDKTRVLYRGYVKNSELTEEGAGGDLDTVELQDQDIIEKVHKSMYSKIYDRGRYSPTREQGVHQFHRIISKIYEKLV